MLVNFLKQYIEKDKAALENSNKICNDIFSKYWSPIYKLRRPHIHFNEFLMVKWDYISISYFDFKKRDMQPVWYFMPELKKYYLKEHERA